MLLAPGPLPGEEELAGVGAEAWVLGAGSPSCWGLLLVLLIERLEEGRRSGSCDRRCQVWCRIADGEIVGLALPVS